MKYGIYEIKNYKSHDDMSQETECFSLDFYENGNLVAKIRNDGMGGCNMTYPVDPFTHADIARIEEDMAKDHFLVDPGSKYERFDEGVGTIQTLHSLRKTIANGLKTKCVFIKDSEVRYIGYKEAKRKPDSRLFEHVKKKYPDAIILNTMPELDALKAIVDMDRKQLQIDVDETPGPPLGQ